MTRVGSQSLEQPLRELMHPDAISDDTIAVRERLAARMATLKPPTDLAAARDAYASGNTSLPVSPRSPRARTITIPGMHGEIGLRILVPPVVRGAYLHLHGGGWMLGANDMWDNHLEFIGSEAGLAAVSVNYRLAPEHVFPAGVDDCVTAAKWLIENALKEFGISWLAIGGESAGAHLAAVALIRLRDEGYGGAFRAANLAYGCYDLSLTPSMRQAEATPVIDRSKIEAMVSAFCGTTDVRDPALSPLYADLANLPPALISIATHDPLLDDSLFMHMRWQAAGNESELAVFPGGVHGFKFMEGELARSANERLVHFLRMHYQ